jgi:hypothetical protein
MSSGQPSARLIFHGGIIGSAIDAHVAKPTQSFFLRFKKIRPDAFALIGATRQFDSFDSVEIASVVGCVPWHGFAFLGWGVND